MKDLFEFVHVSEGVGSVGDGRVGMLGGVGDGFVIGLLGVGNSSSHVPQDFGHFSLKISFRLQTFVVTPTQLLSFPLTENKFTLSWHFFGFDVTC